MLLAGLSASMSILVCAHPDVIFPLLMGGPRSAHNEWAPLRELFGSAPPSAILAECFN